MKQTLQLKLSQHLTLTPQLQQSIRLLQLSTLELNQELEKFLMDNPLLEREDNAAEAPQLAAFQANGQPAETVSQADPEQAPAEATLDATSPEIDWLSAGGTGSVSRDDGEEADCLRSPPWRPACEATCSSR